MAETLKLIAAEYASTCAEKVGDLVGARDGHWWAGVGLYLWTAFLFGNIMGEAWYILAVSGA
jgi:hypothetical protein